MSSLFHSVVLVYLRFVATCLQAVPVRFLTNVASENPSNVGLFLIETIHMNMGMPKRQQLSRAFTYFSADEPVAVSFSICVSRSRYSGAHCPPCCTPFWARMIAWSPAPVFR